MNLNIYDFCCKLKKLLTFFAGFVDLAVPLGSHVVSERDTPFSLNSRVGNKRTVSPGSECGRRKRFFSTSEKSTPRVTFKNTILCMNNFSIFSIYSKYLFNLRTFFRCFCDDPEEEGACQTLPPSWMTEPNF